MKNIYVYLLSLIIPILTGQESWAQQPHFEEENFLSPVAGISLVNGIATDRNNCVWLTTQSGLYRYDGNNFKHYSTLNTNVLQFERMEGILTILNEKSVDWCVKDAKRNLYQADSQSQLKPLLMNNGSQIIFGQTNLELWKGEKKIRIDEFGPSVFEVHYRPEEDRFIIVFYNGEMAQITRADLLAGRSYKMMNNSPFKDSPQRLKLNHYRMFITTRALYYLSSDGLYILDYLSGSIKPIALKGDILSMGLKNNFDNARIFTTVGSAVLLLWYEGNIYELKESADGSSFDTKLLVNGKSGEIPSFLFYSPSHSLLIGCYLNRGLVSYHHRQFSLLSYSDRISKSTENYYYAVLPDNNGYITANGAGIVKLELNGKRKVLYSGKLSVYFLHRDRAGNIWFQQSAMQNKPNYVCFLKGGSKGPVLVFDPGKNCVLTGIYQPNDSVYFLLSDRNLHKITYRNHKPILQLLYQGEKGIQFTTLFAKDQQILWLGHDQGMMEYNINENKIKTIPALSKASLRAITKLAANNYLAGTYDKWLYQYKNGKWTHLFTPDKSTAASVHAFITDSLTNSLWISSNKGISRLPLKNAIETNASDSAEIYAEHFVNFGKDISVEFNGSSNTSSAQVSDSNAAFANASGVVVFNPQMAISSPLPVNVLIEPVHNSDSANQQFRDFRQLEFSAIVPYFGNRDNLEILYKLTNSDETWHRLFPNSIISYNNLKPGNHELQFRLRHFGDGNGKEVFINAANFYTPYRWYETAWFRGGAILTALLLLIAFHYFRIWYILKRKRQLEQLVRSKTSKLQESNQKLVAAIDELTLSESELKQSNFLKDEYYAVLTHDLRSPLKFLSFNISQLLEYAPELKDQSLKNGLVAAYQCSNEVYKLIDEFVYWIQDNEKQLKAQPVETTVLAVVEDSKKMYEHNFQLNQNQFKTEISPTLKINTDPQLLFIVLRNAIDNANKYTQAGNIIVSATMQNGNLQITVADTGRGITEDQVNLLMNLQNDVEQLTYKKRKSLGFYIMAMLTKKLGGSYNIISSREDGTRLVFTIPELKKG